MLIHVDQLKVFSFIFRAGSTVVDVQWPHQLQQFIILSEDRIEVVNTMGGGSKQVLPNIKEEWKYMAHWKQFCIVSDNMCRLFLYDMKGTLSDWFLFYCWSPPTTCAVNENITAIGINEYHIVLSIQKDNQYRYALYTRNMIHLSDVQLTRPCTTIQTLLFDEWLLYDSTEQLYNVIDFKREQHDEPYLSSLKDIKCVATCDETGKLLIVLLHKQSIDISRCPRMDQCNIKIYYVEDGTSSK